MSGGQFPASFRIQSSQEYIAPRHRLPEIPPLRPTSSSYTSAHPAHSPWSSKHSHNYHDNASYYSSTARNYSAISRWPDTRYNAPLTPYDKMDTSKTCKEEVQQESIDLSTSAHAPTTPQSKTSPLNGESKAEDMSIENHLSSINGGDNGDVVKEEAVSVIAENPSHAAITENSAATEQPNNTPISPDHVESILETMFHSEGRTSLTSCSSVIVAVPSCKSALDDLRAESVEKILKSPSPEKSDKEFNFAMDLLDESSDCDKSKEVSPRNNTIPDKLPNSAYKEQSSTETNVSKVSEQSSGKSECNVINANPVTMSETKEPGKEVPSSAIGLFQNGVTDSAKMKPKSSSDEKSKSGSDENTYVEVENELEKMFAGIEDSGVNDSDPLNAALRNSTPKKSKADSHHHNLNPPLPKTGKKKSSKKSKSASSTGASSSKKKSKAKSANAKDASTDNVLSKRVPVIHIEGSKENPTVVQIINSIKLEEDDVSDGKTAAKRKLNTSDRATKRLAGCYSVKNYDPDTSDESWICVFCKLCAHSPGLTGEPTGDLFGPYFIRSSVDVDVENKFTRHSRKSDHIEQVKKKQKRSLSSDNSYFSTSDSNEQKTLEIWAHENCFIWASGIHLIGSKLVGLEDAVFEALNTICTHCGTSGASIGCRARHCKSCVHYSCALCSGWNLDVDTFITKCSVHKDVQ